LIFIARLLYKKRIDGAIAGFYLIFYSVGRFIMEYFRGDVERGSVGSLSTSQFISIFTFILGLVIVIAIIYRQVNINNYKASKESVNDTKGDNAKEDNEELEQADNEEDSEDKEDNKDKKDNAKEDSEDKEDKGDNVKQDNEELDQADNEDKDSEDKEDKKDNEDKEDKENKDK